MKITSIHCGYFKLDGGAMFGVVPRKMWSKMNPPDEQNMCTWALRALLVQTKRRNILFDTGIGNKQDDKFRSHFQPFGDENLFTSLEKAGVKRSDITDVFLTHLHFDHCGGALWKNERTGVVELAFPNATYWSNERHYNWAVLPNEREKASFLKENFEPLRQMERLKFLPVKQNVEFLPGIKVLFTYGHTEAMMIPVIDVNGKKVVYCADTLPSQWHVGMPYVMAYDIRPLQTLKEKAVLLKKAVRNQYIMFFEHDPVAEACTLELDTNGRVVLSRLGKLEDLLD
ncbi:MAG: MBL fold metallo-hydrolase [Saprospiraceae bacterium]|nr:MBL fold metallo-hydrolase [Saprospiraceae bacterium]